MATFSLLPGSVTLISKLGPACTLGCRDGRAERLEDCLSQAVGLFIHAAAFAMVNNLLPGKLTRASRGLNLANGAVQVRPDGLS